MQTASSSSLPPSKPGKAAGPTQPLPPSIKHPQTPAKRVQPPPKEIERIDDPKKCSTAFSKRNKTILSKGEELHNLTGAHVAVILFSPKGNLRCFGKPSVEEVISKYRSHKVEKTIHRYLRHKGDVIPPMSQREWEDWAKKEYDSCTTWETLVPSIIKLEFFLNYLCKKLKDLEDNPSVKATQMSPDRADSEFNVEAFLSLLGMDAFLPPFPGSENNPIGLWDSAVGDGSPWRSNLEGSRNNEDDIFVALEDLDVPLVI